MTLDVENIHSVVHHEDPLCTMLNYVRNFGNAAKEGLKRTTPLGGVLFYKSEVLVCCIRTSCDPVSHISSSTVTTCTDGTTRRTEDKGLGANTWCCRASAFCQTGDNNGKSWNSPIVPISERDSAGWTGQPRTLWPRGAARKRRRGRWESTIPRAVMKNRPTTRPHVTLAGFHLWNERRIFFSEEFLASEEVFTSTAEFCWVNFSLFFLLWNYGIAVTFCFFLDFCWHCYSFLWYWPVSTNTLFRDRS